MRKLFLLVAFFLAFCTSALAVNVGEVVGQMGSTWNERDGETQKTSMGYKLEMNDFLQTGEDGGMILSYVDNTKFTMGPNTELTIDEFAFDTSVVPIEIAMNINVNVGSFTYESGTISKLGGEVNITTATASITVQGTAFTGTVETSGKTTITLLPDSSGNIGEVTVSNDAGSQTLNQVYESVTVLSNDLAPKPPKVLSPVEQKDLMKIDDMEKEIKDEKKYTTLAMENEDIGWQEIEMDESKLEDIEIDSEEAQKIEEAIISEELTVEEGKTESTTTDLAVDTIEVETNVVQDIAIEEVIIDEEIDTSYYDEWEEDLKDWGYIDEENQISVWDAEGEQKMDWDEAKKMYSEMDQAYLDAIGCSDCSWDTINWDSINWDEVDWDAYEAEYNKLLEDYGLTSYNAAVVEDKTEEVVDDATSTTEGYTWEDFDLSDDYYNNSEYIAAGGPPELTITNYCEYNGYDSSWCDQKYLDYLNEWYADDWSLFKDFDSWEKKAKKLFKKWYGWCGSWPNYEWCDGQPKPWKMEGLKDKYVSEWTYEDWNLFYDNTYSWYYTGTYGDSGDDSTSLDEEYGYEDDYDADLELELWLAELDEWYCDYYGYYWDNANQKCGTEWVDNTVAETLVTASGEVLNYTTGDITQTLTTTSGGVSTSTTSTGRVSTLNNDFAATASTSGDYTIINRYNDNHRAYIEVETSKEADIQILQDKEAQHIDVGTSSTQPNITIIQTD